MKSNIDIKKYKINFNSTLFEAIKKINKNKEKFIAVIKNNKFIGTITDGDIRRALLKKKTFNSTIAGVYNTKPYYEIGKINLDYIKNNLKKKKLYQCPILNKQKQLKDIVFYNQKNIISNHSVVIMAGGLGKRLLPYTEKVPKPLIKINGKPMLEKIITQLKKFGLNSIYLSLNYKSKMIENYFKNGSKLQVSIKYLKEKKKLGTAGSLSLLEKKIGNPLIVMNCDIITNLDFNKLIDFYNKNKVSALMCVKEYKLQVPYGVVNLNKYLIKNIDEKPVQKFFVNAGIYLINPNVIKFIPKNKYYDMPELFKKLIKEKKKITAYPVTENWTDAGNFNELKKFNVSFE